MQADIADVQDQRRAIGHEPLGETVGILDAKMSGERAEEHGDDEHAGAEAEFGFEFHGFLKCVPDFKTR
jgi:hypothetical protein